MRAIPSLSEIAVARPGVAKPLDVCIVSSEFLGPVKNGGIATATSGLVEQLFGDGHRITLLYTLVERGVPFIAQKSWSHWQEAFGARGITLDHIQHPGDYRSWRQKSWLVKEFLGGHKFDLVYFNEHHGSGYYALAAKRAGLAPFAEQLHCVITHGSVEWVYAANDEYIQRASDLEMMAFERRSVEWADVVIGPSRYLLAEYERYGWALPAQTYHQPYPLLRTEAKVDDATHDIRELVFFGRLEARKGLWLFCEALDRIRERLRGLIVTFLGRMTDVSGISTGAMILLRASNWPFRIRLLTDCDQDQAIAYLREKGRLAVMPSLADNSPCVVYECMENGIPFITTQGSGADELVHADRWGDVMVEATPSALADRLSRVLDSGARLGAPRFDPRENLGIWSAWHTEIGRDPVRFIVHGPIAWAAAVREDRAPTIVVIDDEHLPLGELADSLSDYSEKYRHIAEVLVLSPRHELLEAFLHPQSDMPMNGDALPVLVLGRDSIDEALQIVASADVVFFVDAEFELLVPFFWAALNLIAQGHAALVSCISAKRPKGSVEVNIVDLPHGDAPAIALLGRSKGSNVWGLSASALGGTLSVSDVFDEQYDEFASASAIGNALSLNARRQDLPFLLLPMVGAITVAAERLPRRRSRVYAQIKSTALAIGLVPSIYPNGAPWLAMSAFGAHDEERELPSVMGTAALESRHPLFAPAAKPLSEFAAALGRVELAIQLGTASGNEEEEVCALLEIARRAIRSRRSYDLSGLLRSGDVWAMGPDSAVAPDVSPEGLKERIAALMRSTLADERPSSGGAVVEVADEPPIQLPPQDIRSSVRVYLNSPKLTLRNGWLTPIRGGRPDERPGLLFVDVPLAGHQRLDARLRGSHGRGATLFIKVLDQSRGVEIGSTGTSIPAHSNTTSLTIPLSGVYALVTIMLAIDDGAGTSRQTGTPEYKLEQLRIS